MTKRHREIIERLAKGETIENYKEGGNSMVPIIHSKEPVTIAPVDSSKLEKGDAVFCKVHGRMYMHLVTALKEDEVQIGNNHGHINGWTKRENVYGIVISVDGKPRGGAEKKVRKLDVDSEK